MNKNDENKEAFKIWINNKKGKLDVEELIKESPIINDLGLLSDSLFSEKDALKIRFLTSDLLIKRKAYLNLELDKYIRIVLLLTLYALPCC